MEIHKIRDNCKTAIPKLSLSRTPSGSDPAHTKVLGQVFKLVLELFSNLSKNWTYFR